VDQHWSEAEQLLTGLGDPATALAHAVLSLAAQIAQLNEVLIEQEWEDLE